MIRAFIIFVATGIAPEISHHSDSLQRVTYFEAPISAFTEVSDKRKKINDVQVNKR